MAPSSPGSESTGEGPPEETPQVEALMQIRSELEMISGNMLTRENMSMLIQEFRMAMREKLAGLQSDLSALDARVEAAEVEVHICQQSYRATEMAEMRQCNMLLSLHRQVEDLENRRRHPNIRVCGLSEPHISPVATTLETQFPQILCPAAVAEIKFDWARTADLEMFYAASMTSG
ncbi:Hypothetical predicted protein [Pelobates cultripes]|uniref:Uncharacterized protein n=1 Tax=Pelobates cultripes TaxID=61616 RepID=A0AAD1SJA9_PELCU|nr:Hypothetical predicted protein [Pelobates cultripes]